MPVLRQTAWAEIQEGCNGVTATAMQGGEEHQVKFYLVLEETLVQLYPTQEYALLPS